VKRIVVRGALALLGAAVVLPAAYLLVALILALIPLNADFRETRNGIPIYLRTNGVHAELVLPTRSARLDWSADHPAGHMRKLGAPMAWIAFGWGDAAFFATTPTWGDLKLRTALVALGGLGEGAMHVEYLSNPAAYAGRELRLSPAQFADLVEYIRGSFTRTPDGRPIRLEAPGYFDTDAFYAAEPTYTFWMTSNEWVRRGLAAAGVRTPAWAPFDSALFFQLRAL
jgi:uncharacterized protein (TIGR02117 family)